MSTPLSIHLATALALIVGCSAAEDDGASETGNDTTETGLTHAGDTGTGTQDTGPDEIPCEDLSTLVADCAALVSPSSNQTHSFFSSIDPDSTTLKADLTDLLSTHTAVSRDGVWDAFRQTDTRQDGTILDVYSDVPDGTPAYTYEFGTDKCGEYDGEGACYNREHTWPSSWYGSITPMQTDLFHVRPTDGYVNGMRSSFPFGLVGVANWTSTNGSLRGPSQQCGYDDDVFEPIDAYKGDLARGLLYMSVRYADQDGDWETSEATDGAALLPWAEELLVSWHIEDPVDDVEQARNDAVFAAQGNRNPFIDHPQWVCLIENF